MWVCGVCASFQSCFLWFLLSNVFNLHWENILGPGTKGQQMEIDLPWSCVALQAHVSRWNFTLYSANLCFACESDFCYCYVDTIIIYYIARFPATITAPFTLRLVMHLSNEAENRVCTVWTHCNGGVERIYFHHQTRWQDVVLSSLVFTSHLLPMLLDSCLHFAVRSGRCTRQFRHRTACSLGLNAETKTSDRAHARYARGYMGPL